MYEDESVLIGDEFCELIGGAGTYSNFITEINAEVLNVRKRLKKRVLRFVLWKTWFKIIESLIAWAFHSKYGHNCL
ncbi:hypothetical protein [Dolichospermum compactum]|uniref:Uncharacterized protein n=1 Tax=Dolichospermum compactum NIES-806 TaxID=1973481 RepID=A0A1Z4V0I1_9CYAN|nr:hypothetical protein [Dolichospermum compactum]BAZ84869.1 hypothetical protein NIES806_10630 [Dolichospermum compactum NIES-806]